MNDYDEMLKRLKAYRRALGLRQRQMCGILGISQVQYSYLENGIIRLSHDNLSALHKAGLHPDYLITGSDSVCDVKEFDIIFDGIGIKHRNFTLRIAAEIIIEKYRRGRLTDDISRRGTDADIIRHMRFLTAVLRSWDNFSMLGFVRSEAGLTQTDMMERFGIGSRKYRELERGEKYPDADLLISLYKTFGYPPSMFMNIDDIRVLAVKYVLNLLESRERLSIMRLVKRINELVRI